MKIWAIGDLHLGFSTGKWMDKFGDHWRDHHLKVAAAWNERIAPADIVLLPGDFSWAMKPEQVREDFRWLAALPGKKVLIKGNHDYWWPQSKKKMRDLLPPDVHALKKNAIILDGVPVVGVRGSDFLPLGERTQEQVDADLERELREFTLSLEHLGTLGPVERPPVALFHYPPFPLGASESPFTVLAEQAGCRHGLYGHLHSEADWQQYFQGEVRGLNYQLVSCDFLDFIPILIEDLG